MMMPAPVPALSDERRLAIIRLLQTRDDNLPLPRRGPTPVGPPGFISGRDEKGKPLRWLSCPDCLTNGRTLPGCETCGGRGEVPDLGPDPYARNEHVLPFGFDSTRHDASHERDRNIELLRLQTRPPRSESELLEEANRRGYLWEESRRIMYARFDYAALDRALEQLRNLDDGPYHSLHAVYIYGWLTELSPTAELAIERGLSFLHERLPEKLRWPGMPEHDAADRQRLRRAC